jgi:hypothetical protein
MNTTCPSCEHEYHSLLDFPLAKITSIYHIHVIGAIPHPIRQRNVKLKHRWGKFNLVLPDEVIGQAQLLIKDPSHQVYSAISNDGFAYCGEVYKLSPDTKSVTVTDDLAGIVRLATMSQPILYLFEFLHTHYGGVVETEKIDEAIQITTLPNIAGLELTVARTHPTKPLKEGDYGFDLVINARREGRGGSPFPIFSFATIGYQGLFREGSQK